MKVIRIGLSHASGVLAPCPLARVQLKHFLARIAEIQRAVRRFWSLIEDVPILIPHLPSWDESTCGAHYFARGIYQPQAADGLSCAQFCRAVEAEGVPCSLGANAPLHLHPYFHEADLLNQGQPTALAFGLRDVRQGSCTLPVSENVDSFVLSIPWFKHDDPARIERYAEAYRKIAHHAEQLTEMES